MFQVRPPFIWHNYLHSHWIERVLLASAQAIQPGCSADFICLKLGQHINSMQMNEKGRATLLGGLHELLDKCSSFDMGENYVIALDDLN